MEKKKYDRIVSKYKPKEKRMWNVFIAFTSGGLLGVIAQGLIDLYSYLLDVPSKTASTFMIITIIFFTSLFTSIGFFDKLVNYCKCGLIIPITGFAHSMTSAGIEYKQEGLVTGIGSNLFKLAGTVILYGTVSAFFLGIIRLIVMGG